MRSCYAIPVPAVWRLLDCCTSHEKDSLGLRSGHWISKVKKLMNKHQKKGSSSTLFTGLLGRWALDRSSSRQKGPLLSW